MFIQEVDNRFLLEGSKTRFLTTTTFSPVLAAHTLAVLKNFMNTSMMRVKSLRALWTPRSSGHTPHQQVLGKKTEDKRLKPWVAATAVLP